MRLDGLWLGFNREIDSHPSRRPCWSLFFRRFSCPPSPPSSTLERAATPKSSAFSASQTTRAGPLCLLHSIVPAFEIPTHSLPRVNWNGYQCLGNVSSRDDFSERRGELSSFKLNLLPFLFSRMWRTNCWTSGFASAKVSQSTRVRGSAWPRKLTAVAELKLTR